MKMMEKRSGWSKAGEVAKEFAETSAYVLVVCTAWWIIYMLEGLSLVIDDIAEGSRIMDNGIQRDIVDIQRGARNLDKI